jgi:hypothetical protein
VVAKDSAAVIDQSVSPIVELPSDDALQIVIEPVPTAIEHGDDTSNVVEQAPTPKSKRKRSRSAKTEQHELLVLPPSPSPNGQPEPSKVPSSGTVAELAGASSTTAAERMSTLRILVAEDDRLNQRIMKHQLKNYNVTVANDGVECLEEIAKSSFDIVFMDK